MAPRKGQQQEGQQQEGQQQEGQQQEGQQQEGQQQQSQGVTLADVQKIVSDALKGHTPSGDAPAAGSDIAAQLREELEKIRGHQADEAKADKARIRELEKALGDAAKSAGAPAGAVAGVTEDLKKKVEDGPEQAVRAITQRMWGDPE